MLKLIRVLSVFTLGLALLLPISLSALAQSAINYNPSGDSGAYYDGYLSYSSPGIKPNSPRVIESLVRHSTTEKSQVLPSEEKDKPSTVETN